MDSATITRTLPNLLHIQAQRDGTRTALVHGETSISYGVLSQLSRQFACRVLESDLVRNDRVAIYLPKQIETVVAMLGASLAGAVFVPINPVLKSMQVAHIIRDSGARVLVTSAARFQAIRDDLATCHHLESIIFVDDAPRNGLPWHTMGWESILHASDCVYRNRLENDIAALLYTSGSTGRPKGVVLSHRNLVVGAQSVATYLENHSEDRILSLLPLSFDAGFSQLTTALSVGARVILLDYLLPGDVVKVCEREAITGITGVPPLWMQLVQQRWSKSAAEHIRYFANTGGKMPRDTLDKLRSIFTSAKPYLMYGLTEAFRSTYLSPDEVDRRPDSIGKAIPNVEIDVVRPDGTSCAPDEPGELVHRGPLVSLGYWNDPAKTAERFRPAPGQPPELSFPEMAVWSGDTVKRDAEGFLYFIGRQDDMIKTSGYRVSPTEIEEVAFSSSLVSEAVAIGLPHDTLGHKIVLLATPMAAGTDVDALLGHFRKKVPIYMVPHQVEWAETLPRNANGKLDRVSIKSMLMDRIADADND